MPDSDWKTIYKEEMMKRTRNRNEIEGKVKGTRYFKEIHRNKKKKPWFKGINAERRFVTTINRIRANHYNLKELLARKNYCE